MCPQVMLSGEGRGEVGKDDGRKQAPGGGGDEDTGQWGVIPGR